MLTYWTDLDRTFSALDQFRRRLDRVFDEFDGQRVRGSDTTTFGSTWSNGFPQASLYDAGPTLELLVEVPGLDEKNVRVSLQEDRVSITGQRPAEAPEGFSVHRRERPAVEFNRSFTLPCRVEWDKVKAELKGGVLRLEMPKHPESQPREIPVALA